MKVASILKSKGGRVVTMRPDSSITSVIQRMKLERIDGLVIPSGAEYLLARQQIGELLYQNYMFAFEIASLLLLVAIIGAVVMAKKRI